MESGSADSKKMIMDVVKKIIAEENDLNQITVRQIAGRAGVGVGLINYYFKSKNHLISQVLGNLMAEMISEHFEGESIPERDPVVRLKTMLRELYSFGAKYEKHVHYLISSSLLEGEMGAYLMLIPKLRDIFPDKQEFELRLISLQILMPVQAASLNPESFRLFSGVDLRDIAERNQFIDHLIDNVLGSK